MYYVFRNVSGGYSIVGLFISLARDKHGFQGRVLKGGITTTGRGFLFGGPGGAQGFVLNGGIWTIARLVDDFAAGFFDLIDCCDFVRSNSFL